MPPKRNSKEDSKGSYFSNGTSATVFAETEQPNALVVSGETSPCTTIALQPDEEKIRLSLTSDENTPPVDQSDNDWETEGFMGIQVPTIESNPHPEALFVQCQTHNHHCETDGFMGIQDPTIESNPPPEALFVQWQTHNDCETEGGQNFSGEPVSCPPSTPLYMPPEFIQKIGEILTSSGIISQICDDSSNGAVHTSTTHQLRIKTSGDIKPLMIVFLTSLSVPQVCQLTELTLAVTTATFLKTGSETSKKTVEDLNQMVRNFVSLFSEESISLEQILSLAVHQKECSVKVPKSLSLEFLSKTLKGYPLNDRLKVLFQIFCLYIDKNAQKADEYDQDYWSFDRRVLIPFLETINKDCFLRTTSSSLNDLAIQLIKEANEHHKNIRKAEIIVGEKLSELNALDAQYEDFLKKPHSKDEKAVLHVALKKASLEYSNSSLELKNLKEKFPTFMLLVCSIFRELNKRNSSGDLFWEIMRFVQNTKMMEQIPALCFDASKEFESAKVNALFTRDAKPTHLSSASDSSGNSGLISLKTCFELVKENRFILDITKTGGGKSTCYSIAQILKAVIDSLNGTPTSFLLIGPPNHASDTLIHVVCHVIQEKLNAVGRNVKIVPVIGVIAPKMNQKSDKTVVYVFVTYSMNRLPAVMSLFGPDHKVIVMVDDNQEFGKCFVDGFASIRDNTAVSSLTMCSASYHGSSFDSSDNVLTIGSTTTSISYVSSEGMICHEIDLSMYQMRQIETFFSSNRNFYEANKDFFLKMRDFLTMISTSNVNESNVSDLMSKLSAFYELFLLSGLINILVHEKVSRHEGEMDLSFFDRLLSVVLKFVVSVLNRMFFDKNTVDKFENHLSMLRNPSLVECSFNITNVATEMLKFLHRCIGFHDMNLELPKLPTSIIDVSSLSDLSRKYKDVLIRLSSSGFVIPEDLTFAKEVPILTEKEYLAAAGSLHELSHRIVFLGPNTDPTGIASEMAKYVGEKNGFVEGVDQKPESDDDEKRGTDPNRRLSTSSGASRGGNSSSSGASRGGNSSSSGASRGGNNSADEAVKFSKLNTPLKMKYLLSRYDKIKKNLSQNSPVPNQAEVTDFARFVLAMETPLASIIFNNFVLGVFVPTAEMSEEMMSLVIKIFQEGRICLMIQEEAWNLMSMNFILLHKVNIFCFSEVSLQYFLQNILGRFGRVDQGSSPASIMCFTPSGRIVDNGIAVHSDSKCQELMVSRQQLVSNSTLMSKLLLHRFFDFISNCFNVRKNEVEFMLNLIRMSDAAIYDPRFKYSCFGNDYKSVFQLMSSYLISGLCNLGVDVKHTDTREMKNYLNDYLSALAINKASTRFEFMRNSETREKVCCSFQDAIHSAMPSVPDLFTGISLSCAVNNNEFLTFAQPNLVRMFFDIREMVKFVDLVLAFLTNLYSSKTLQEQNAEIRAVISVVSEVRKNMDFIVHQIVSRVNQDAFLKEVSDKRSGSVANHVSQDPLKSLYDELRSCPEQRLGTYLRILRNSSISFPACVGVFERYKTEYNSFGENCLTKRLLDELRTTFGLRKTDLEQCSSAIADITTKLSELTGPPALRSKKKLELTAKMTEEESRRLTLERALADIPKQITECESSLLKYAGMSKKDFLDRFLLENFKF